MTVVVGAPEDFTLEAFRRVAVDGEGVVICPAAVRVMGEARAGFERLLRADPSGFIYGVTTRPGVEVGTAIPPEDLRDYARRFRGVGRGWRVITGSRGAAALAADVPRHARNRLRLAEAIFALSIEALAAPLDAYDEALDDLRGDEAERTVLHHLRDHLSGAVTSGRLAHQAPVSYRILPQVLGQAQRAVQAGAHAPAPAPGSGTADPACL